MPRSRPIIANLVIAAPIVVGFAIYGLVYRPTAESPKPKIFLKIPYFSQAPDGQWVAPWDEACEEASILMIDAYYRGQTQIDKNRGKQTILDMVKWEDTVLKTNTDTDAAQTVRLIRAKASFTATIKRNPLIEEIKKEIAEGRPILFMHNMYKLYDERDLGDSYHVSVITGYDDTTGEFLVNDPARPRERYRYEILMNALHDFNPKTREADAIPTVVFTSDTSQ